MKLLKEDATKPFSIKGPAGTTTVAPLTQKQKDDFIKSGAKVTPLEEEAGRKYTAEESAAVGKAVAKSLIKVLRGQGDEVVDIKLTGVGLNKFGIKVRYGNDKGQDTFRFTLNPDEEDITLDLGKGDHQQLVDFIITQGNTVSMPTPDLESKLADAMKKYVSEPVNTEPDPMAAMEPESDPTKIGNNIPEVTKHVGGKYVNYPEKGGKRLGTFDTKSAAQKQLAAIEINKHKNESAKPDYIDLDNDGNRKESMKKAAQDKRLAEDLDLGHQDDEPGMLLGDLYSIMKSTKELYEMVSQFEGQGEVDFPHWWQAKIIKAKACLSAANQYLDFEVNKPQQRQVNTATVALQEVDTTAGTAGTKSTTSTPGDVAALAKAQKSATTVQTRSKNINNITEFPGAFEQWMTTLGLVPGKVSRGSIEAQVRKTLTKLGYK